MEVVDVSTTDENDSLVLLVTYGDTRCLFAGDIGNDTQKRIADQYMDDSDEPFKIDVLKIPHHGGDINYYFIRTFMPDYAIIPVGKGNHYNHPYDKTLDMLGQAKVKVYRTDIDGDITVKSDGEQLAIQSSR